MLGFLSANWVNILLVVVGLSAFIIYFWQKRDERRAAATVVKEQIDLIEERVRTLKSDHQLGNISVYHSKTIIQDNLWEKHKHLLIKKLQRSDAEIVQRFFDSAEQIEHARSDIIQTITRAWEHKSSVMHQLAGEFAMAEATTTMSTATDNLTEVKVNMNAIELFRQIYYPLELVFTPDVAINTLIKYLNDFDNLKGTSAYKTIQSWSYDNK